MKRIVLLVAALTFLSVACNRSGERSSGGGTGMKQEEQMNTSDSSMGSHPENESMSGDNMDPAVNESSPAPLEQQR